MHDDATLERIRALAIPPAWRKVWICPHENGHIQAVGVDAAGRRQYLYHEQWRKDRDEEKFDRVLALAARLPEIRARVRDDLAVRGLARRRVEAVAFDLVDRGEEYAEEHGTRGVATLLREQVRVSGERMFFDYVAKGGIRRQVSVRDQLLAKAVRALLRARTSSDRLLVYRDDARASYVDPRVVTAFENGTTVAAALRRASRADSADAEREVIDRAVIRMLRRSR